MTSLRRRVRELARLRAAIGLHHPSGLEGARVCAECRKVWPCLTAWTARVE